MICRGGMARKKSRKCSFVGFLNRANEGDISFHIVPASENRRQVWLQACALSPNEPAQYLYVCGVHVAGGNGPTPEHPDPVACEPLTPGKVDALDGLLGLGAGSNKNADDSGCYFDSPNVRQGSTANESLAEESGIENQITFLYNFINSLPDNIAKKESAVVALNNVTCFTRSSEQKELVNTDGPTTRINTDGPPPRKTARRSLMIDTEVDACRTLVTHDQGVEVEDCDMLPFMPDSPLRVTSNQDVHRTISIQCERAPVSYMQCHRSTPKKFHFFTGVTQSNFEVLYSFLGGDEICSSLKHKYTNGTPVKKLKTLMSPKDSLFMTLVRLRRGISLVDLAFVFGISLAGASAIVYTWTRFMSISIQRIKKKMFVTTEEQDAIGNPLFEKFPNVRVIIDTTEFKIQHPYHFQLQSNTYFNCKSTNTIKFLVGIARNGGISFVSKGYEGSMSDKQIVLQSGLLEELHEKDAIMTDRGFDIEAELNEIDVDLYMPNFLGRRKHMTAREEMNSKSVASVRNFVEIANKRIKDFRLLRGVIPNKLLPVLDDLVPWRK